MKFTCPLTRPSKSYKISRAVAALAIKKSTPHNAIAGSSSPIHLQPPSKQHTQTPNADLQTSQWSQKRNQNAKTFAGSLLNSTRNRRSSLINLQPPSKRYANPERRASNLAMVTNTKPDEPSTFDAPNEPHKSGAPSLARSGEPGSEKWKTRRREETSRRSLGSA